MSRGDKTRRYESMVVLRADLQEAGVKEQLERLRKLLETHGAEIAGVHEWGIRELAYEIAKQRRGFYALFEYSSTSAAVAELERQLKLSDVVLRFVSVRRDKEPPALAVSFQWPALGKTSRARYERGLAVALTRAPGPAAVIRIVPRNDAGRTASRTVHGLPATAAGRFPTIDTWTGFADPLNARKRNPSAAIFMCGQTYAQASGLRGNVARGTL